MSVYYFQYNTSQPGFVNLYDFDFFFFYYMISFIFSFMLGPCFIIISTFPSFLGFVKFLINLFFSLSNTVVVH